jgi:Flp pilus assembly protein TadD
MIEGLSLDAVMESAIAQQRAGKTEAAEGLYRAVLRRQADHAVANHNLGVLIAQGGRAEQSLPFFKAALDAEPAQGLFWMSYARGLLAAGRAAEAVEMLEGARRRGVAGPAFDALMAHAGARAGSGGEDPERLYAMGYALTAQGDFAAAVEAYRRAIAIRPDFADAHFHLGSVLSENGDVAQGFAHFMRRAELVYGSGAKASGAAETPEPLHKSKHDREQRDYLAGGKAPDSAPSVADMFRIEDGARLAGPAVNPANATPELLAAWRRNAPQMVVIEDFLTPQALEKLRRYCAGSTIWRRVYEAGYIGATPQDGFACPLLAQIAEELQSTYPEILGPHRFRYLGAFKYDSELSTGTNTHADNSAVNVNFYIAPDEANLDPASGGMEIWDVSAPDEAAMRRYNGDEAAARAFLSRSGATSTIVPHRANRAILFRSDLFHKTDRCAFKEGYLNKRINVSLLFGALGEPTR